MFVVVVLLLFCGGCCHKGEWMFWMILAEFIMSFIHFKDFFILSGAWPTILIRMLHLLGSFLEGGGLSWSFEVVCLRECVNYSTLNLFSLLSKLILLLTLHASRSYFEISENWQSLKIITCITRKKEGGKSKRSNMEMGILFKVST